MFLGKFIGFGYSVAVEKVNILIMFIVKV